MSHALDRWVPLCQRDGLTPTDNRILNLFILRAVIAQQETSRSLASLAAHIGLPEAEEERVQRLVEDVTAALPPYPTLTTIDQAIVDLFVDEFLPQFATKETP